MVVWFKLELFFKFFYKRKQSLLSFLRNYYFMIKREGYDHIVQTFNTIKKEILQLVQNTQKEFNKGEN